MMSHPALRETASTFLVAVPAITGSGIQNFGSLPDLTAISRSAITHGLSRPASTYGAEPSADLTRAGGADECQLEAIRDGS